MIAAKDMPEIANDKFPYAMDIVAPPKPKTNIVAATTTFLVFVKSTWLWIRILRPFTQGMELQLTVQLNVLKMQR